MENKTIIQFFEWYLPSDASLWNEANKKAKSLAEMGFTDVWLPPAYKGTGGKDDVGYGVYDMYDLGEFNQKNTVKTKYGSKDEYISAINSLKNEGLKILADVVLNHRLGADETEIVKARVYDINNRNHFIEEREIKAYTKFNFDGRNNKYSNFKWNYTHFDGCDWDANTNEQNLYLFENKNWDDQVDLEKGNYDYLMGSDLDLNNPEVYDEITFWGKWYLNLTNVDGFRVDAVKHINFTNLSKWIIAMRKFKNNNLFVIAEYWNSHLPALKYYLDKTANTMHLFDVPLHYNFYKAANSNGMFDMSKILDNTLLKDRSNRAITIVDNHDTQPGQALESFINLWFKLHAYSLILLKKDGIPCVFYGDLYGIQNNNIPPIGKDLENLIKLRKDIAYGDEITYFDDENTIGFTRLGSLEKENSGLCVIMTDSKGGTKRMCMGEKFIGEIMVDIFQNTKEEIKIGEDGCADFIVNDGSVSVYVLKEYANQI